MFLEVVQDKHERGSFMAERFQIQRHQNSDSLHLRLTGVFDEEATLTLIEELHRNRMRVSKIFVHTGALDQVLDDGIKLFRSSLGSLDRLGAQIIFTGKAGREIAGEAPAFLFIK